MLKFGFAFALLVSAGVTHAGDAFDGLKCGTDIAKALVGKKMTNEAVVGVEKRHTALMLKHEGSEELDDPLFYEGWTICGSSYHMLLKKDVVTDVVKANHSKASPWFLGPCDENRKPIDDTVLAILKPSDAGAAKLPATTAWRIDAKKARFVAIDPSRLMCSRDGIATVDGGR